MRILIMLAACFSLIGCMEEENWCNTLEIEYYKPKVTEFYTIMVPVYKKEPC